MHSTDLLKLNLTLLLISIQITGCADAFEFDVQADVDEFTVPGNPYLHHDGAPLEKAQIPPIEIAFGALDSGSISLSELYFYVTDTSLLPTNDQDTLEFLETIQVTVVPNDPLLAELVIATWTGPAPPGATMIPLKVNPDYNLQPYLAAGFHLQIATSGVVPYDDVSVKGQARFTVNPL